MRSDNNKNPADDAAERQRRDNEAADQARFFRQNQVGGFKPFEEVGKPKNEEAATLDFGDTPLVKPEFGVYSREGAPCAIEYSDKGVAPLVKCPSFGFEKNFNKNYGEAMDFLAGQKGCNSIKIDFPDEKSVNVRQMNKLAKLAEDRGLTVQWGPNITRHIAKMETGHAGRSLLGHQTGNKNTAKDMLDAKEKTNIAVLEGRSGFDTEQEYKRAELNSKNSEKPSADDFKKDLDKATAGKTDPEKQKIIEAEIAKIEARASSLDATKDNMEKRNTMVDTHVNKGELDKAGMLTSKNVNDSRNSCINEMKNEHPILSQKLGICKTALMGTGLGASDAEAKVQPAKDKLDKVTPAALDAVAAAGKNVANKVEDAVNQQALQGNKKQP
jgi:hypothetical protein